MNETAKIHFDKAVHYLESADVVDDTPSCMCYTAMGQLSLEIAKFALANHALVRGIDEDAIPERPSPVSPAPSGGPRVWGASS